MDRERTADWIARYEAAWRAAGTDALADLFSAQVVYLASPWAEPVHGLSALAAFWDAEREGPDEQFTATAQLVAVDGDTAVARIAVHYEHGESWRDLWVLHFDADGRCDTFEEWPFTPDQPDGHD